MLQAFICEAWEASTAVLQHGSSVRYPESTAPLPLPHLHGAAKVAPGVRVLLSAVEAGSELRPASLAPVQAGVAALPAVEAQQRQVIRMGRGRGQITAA